MKHEQHIPLWAVKLVLQQIAQKRAPSFKWFATKSGIDHRVIMGV